MPVVRIDLPESTTSIKHEVTAEGINHATGLRKEDISIGLAKVHKENWPFGGSIAQYAD